MSNLDSIIELYFWNTFESTLIKMMFFDSDSDPDSDSYSDSDSSDIADELSDSTTVKTTIPTPMNVSESEAESDSDSNSDSDLDSDSDSSSSDSDFDELFATSTLAKAIIFGSSSESDWNVSDSPTDDEMLDSSTHQKR